MKNICIFGDSITWGATDTGGGWAQRLRNHIDTHNLPYELYSLGVCGDTSDGLLKRFAIEAQARNPQIIVIAIGTNDAAYRNSVDNNVVPLDRYRSNIQTIIDKSRIHTPTIVVIGLPCVDESKTVPLPDSLTGDSKQPPFY